MKTGYKLAIGSIVALAIYNEFQKRNNTPKVYISNIITGKYNARTLPPFGIFIKPEHSKNNMLIKHELVHWQQYQKEGLLNFIKNYCKAHSQFGYDLNPYEIEARLLSGEKQSCIHNYTQCVRNGNALTVNSNTFRI